MNQEPMITQIMLLLSLNDDDNADDNADDDADDDEVQKRHINLFHDH